MQNDSPQTDRRKRLLLKIPLHAGSAIGIIGLICMLTILFFPDPIVNRFIKPRIIKSFTEAYPAYTLRIAEMNYGILKNRFGFDSVAISTVDSSFLCNIDQFSISRIGWMHLLWGGKLLPDDFASSFIDAKDMRLNFQQAQYELRCGLLRVSIADSVMTAYSIDVHPLAGDDKYFEGSKFRRTRLRFVTPQFNIIGLACLELLQRKSYRARSLKIHDVFLDVLVNKDKPDSKDTSGPFMPNEILSSVNETLQIDSLSILNGRLMYCERFVLGSNPAWIILDSLNVLVEGIANHDKHDAGLVINADGNLANAGLFNLHMTIPAASPVCSFKYSGSVSRMDLNHLNSFLEISDQMRIKTGVLQKATFEVNVVSGCANGFLRGVYNDLTLASIDKNTGSEKGFSNGFISFIANNFKIRKTNVPNKSGLMKIGKVEYTRKPDDPFIQFAWFSLRTGVRDVVGF